MLQSEEEDYYQHENYLKYANRPHPPLVAAYCISELLFLHQFLNTAKPIVYIEEGNIELQGKGQHFLSQFAQLSHNHRQQKHM